MSLPYPQDNDPWVHEFKVKQSLETPELVNWVSRFTCGEPQGDAVVAAQFIYRIRADRVEVRRKTRGSFPLGHAMAELFTCWVGLLPLDPQGKGPWCRYFPRRSSLSHLEIPFTTFVEKGKDPLQSQRPGSYDKSFLGCSFRVHKARTFGEAVLKVSRPRGGGVHFQDLGAEVVVIGEHSLARFAIEDRESLRALDFDYLGSGLSRLFKPREWVALARSLADWGRLDAAMSAWQQVQRDPATHHHAIEIQRPGSRLDRMGAPRRSRKPRPAFEELLQQLPPETALWLVTVAKEARQNNHEAICDRCRPRELTLRDGPDGAVAAVAEDFDPWEQAGWPGGHRRHVTWPGDLWQISSQGETFWIQVSSLSLVWKRRPKVVFRL